MRIEELRLTSFRNYPSLTFRPGPGFNYIHGRNGAGKTNLLEAVYFLANLRSFRRAARSRMIAAGAGGMHLWGRFGGGRGTVTLEAAVRAGERKYQVNGKAESDLLGYLGRVHVAVFFPESLEVIKGGPAGRRRFFDRAIAAEEPRHLAEAREYNRLLAERNRLLKEGRDSGTIQVWTGRLLESAARLAARRCRYMMRFRRRLQSLEQDLSRASAPCVRVGYTAAGTEGGDVMWKGLLTEGGKAAEETGDREDGFVDRAREVLRAAAERTAAAERRRAVTLWGPHLDDFMVSWKGRRARDAASQGEQRLAMILMILAAAEGYRRKRGEEPIVLLDDLSSELDRERREAVLRFLGSMGAQVFITSTERPRGTDSVPARCFAIEDGRIAAA